MTLAKWQRRRIVEQDAHGDRRVYWTLELLLVSGFGVGAELMLLGGIGRYDLVSAMVGPFLLRLSRVADSTMHTRAA